MVPTKSYKHSAPPEQRGMSQGMLLPLFRPRDTRIFYCFGPCWRVRRLVVVLARLYSPTGFSDLHLSTCTMKKLIAVLRCCLLACMVPFMGMAQDSEGKINGTVKDPDGAVVSGSVFHYFTATAP